MSHAEQSNSSAILSDRLMLKLFRRVESGLNPDLEVVRFLTERRFPNIAPVAGYVTVRHGESEPGTVAMVQQYVQNEGDSWSRTLDTLGAFADRVLADTEPAPASDTSVAALLHAAATPTPEPALRLLGSYNETARLLGTRTAEMHRALASAPTIRPSRPSRSARSTSARSTSRCATRPGRPSSSSPTSSPDCPTTRARSPRRSSPPTARSKPGFGRCSGPG